MALIAVVVTFLAIISGSGGSGSSSSSNDSATTPAATTTTTKKKTTTQAKKKTATTGTSGSKTYTVQVGDTLGGIANKTGVPLSRIEELNPNVDPHAMTTGQQIRLR